MATTSATTGTNIDVAGIVSQLMTIEQRPLAALDQKEASYQAKLSALGTIKGALASFQTAVAGLTDAGKFQALKTTSSDSSIATASAAATAMAGTYSLDVTKLAQAQKLATAGQASQTAAIGTGASTTLTFDFGTITGMLNTATGKYSGGPTSTISSGAFTVPTSASGTGTYALSIDGINLQAPVTVDAGGTVVTAATLDASLATFLAANTGYSKTGSFASNNLVLTKADGTPINIVTTLTGDTAAGTFAGAGFVGTTASSPASFLSNGNGTKTVTIDATNNSLQGIRDAINNAKVGVTATIINDGSATPYRLVLSSDSIGKSNSIKISVAGDAALSTLLTQDPGSTPLNQNLAETVTAQNAEFKVNGIAVSKASNTITDAIQDVTLNLLNAPTTTPISVTVARDTTTASASVASFVKAYNDLNTALKNASAYDPTTKQGAILQGDATVLGIQSQVRAALGIPVSNPGGSITTLSQIGVAFQKDGSLALDTTKLNTAISNNFSDVAALFATVSKASDSLVAYSSATASTKPGNYAVDITTLATQGNSTGNVNLNAGSTTIAASTTMGVTLDGTTASVALAAGTYTATQLAAMIQSAINGTSVFSSAGSAVTATINGSGFMSITSNRYGSASNISLASGAGTPVANFMGAAPPAPTAGVDVAGTINGAAATGSGQFLTSIAGNATGLKIQVNGGTTGARGAVTYSQGYAYALNQLSTSLLADNGPLDGKTKGINSSITDIGKQRDELNTRLAATQAQLTKQYSALDVMLSSMNQTSTYLTQQLANLPRPY